MTQKKLVLSKTTLKNLTLKTGIKTGYSGATCTEGDGDTTSGCSATITEGCTSRTTSCSGGYTYSTGSCVS
jgi:hypothetical protein